MNSCAKGMLGPTVMEKSKSAPVPKGGTKKDQKAVMLRVDKSDKIPVAHPSWKQHHHT